MYYEFINNQILKQNRKLVKELISIITPSYNSAIYIEETIQSIINQTHTNWELLITDDSSKDDTVRIVKSYIEKDKRIKLFVLSENQGAGIARNNSIKEAQGRYIAFCDSDDVWLPDKLEKHLKFIQTKNTPFSYTSYWARNEKTKTEKKIECKLQITQFDLMKDNCVGCLTVIYDSHYFGKIYMPTLRKRQDWGLWLTLIKKCKKAYGLQEPLATYRIREQSISSNKLSLIKYNVAVYREVLGFSILKSYIMFFFLFVPSYLLKKIRIK